jgi:hypothetical protein
MSKNLSITWCSRWAVIAHLGLAASLAAVVLAQAPVAAAGVLEVDNACDRSIDKVAAPAGTTVLLVGPAVHTCIPTFDPVTGALLTGNGITVDAEGVTLDLNGRSIHSASDVLAEARAVNPSLSVTSTGVSLRGKNNRIVNSSPLPSLVDNFTGNFEVRAQDSAVVGTLTDAGYNLVGGNAHGGAALTVLASLRVTIDTLQLQDMGANGGTGLEVRRSESITLRNSRIEGLFTGARVRDSKFVSLLGNPYVSGHQGGGAEVRTSEGTTISANVVADNQVDGVRIAGDTKSTAVTNDTIQNNGGCGIRVVSTAQSYVIAPNVFFNNASADVCIK